MTLLPLRLGDRPVTADQLPTRPPAREFDDEFIATDVGRAVVVLFTSDDRGRVR